MYLIVHLTEVRDTILRRYHVGTCRAHRKGEVDTVEVKQLLSGQPTQVAQVISSDCGRDVLRDSVTRYGYSSCSIPCPIDVS